MKCVVVGCSAGVDSMALLDQTYKSEKRVVVAHVNYKKRESADIDQAILEAYCKKRDIPLYVHIATGASGNFQDWARKERYSFFEQVANNVKADTVLLAHHMDDVIETYLFQKQSGRIPQTYGIAQKSVYGKLNVVRPFLSYEKKELMEYCKNNQIEYGCDESNFSDDYTRNKIRHSLVEKMTRKEKEQMVLEIQKENERLEKKRAWVKQKLTSTFSSWKQDNEAWFILDMFLFQAIGKHFSKKQCVDILKQLHHPTLIELDGFWLENYQDRLYCEKKQKRVSVVLDSIEYKDYGPFSIRDTGSKIESVFLKEEDFPITIRNVKACDQIELRYGTKRVHRFFIDRKISKIKRKNWLVMENCEGSVIFVPGIGCDISHYNEKTTVFMVQL